MALTPCPECRNPVARSASSCPKCGNTDFKRASSEKCPKCNGTGKTLYAHTVHGPGGCSPTMVEAGSFCGDCYGKGFKIVDVRD